MQSVRYVILHHTGVPEPHFDLMFQKNEGDELLTTWRSFVWPIVEPTKVWKLADHRPMYLDFEGPVSGDRGQVTRVVGGTCQVFPYMQNQYTVKLLEPGEPRILFIEQSPHDFWMARTFPAA